VRRAAFTIVSKNYLSFARALAASWCRNHPDQPFFVVLADEVDEYIDPSEEQFELVTIAHLGLPDFSSFVYQYSIMELNTAVKPYAFRWLFDERGFDQIVYLDPDIKVYKPLDSVFEALSDSQIALIPHMRRPQPDTHRPSDNDIVASGCYNLGFIGLTKGADSDLLLDWWMRKLYRDCRVDLESGLFVDQKWIDLVPGFFTSVGVVRAPGYNVAYWNLHERTVSYSDGHYLVDEEELAFFHFSGYSPYAPDILSKHQTRHRLLSGTALRDLCDDYRADLFKADFENTERYPYAFSTLKNGVEINIALISRLIQWCLARRLRFPDPMAKPDEFCAWLNSPAGCPQFPRLTPLHVAVLNLRPDVERAFPDARRIDPAESGLDAWMKQRGADELSIKSILRFDSNIDYLDLVKDLLDKLKNAQRRDVIDAYPGLWFGGDDMDEFRNWIRSYGISELGLESCPADAVEAAACGVEKALHIYFLRPDLQERFCQLESKAVSEGFIEWLRNEKLDELTGPEISLFEGYCFWCPKHISKLRFMYSSFGRIPGECPSLPAARLLRMTKSINLGLGELARWLRDSHVAGVPSDSDGRDSSPSYELIQRELQRVASPREVFKLKKGSSQRRSDNDSRLVLNLAGYFKSFTGMGESARSMARSIDTSSVSVTNIALPNSAIQLDSCGAEGLRRAAESTDSTQRLSASEAAFSVSPEADVMESPERLFGWPIEGADVSITVANADSVRIADEFLPENFRGKVNVGFWVWETEKMPPLGDMPPDRFDEIWTPSEHSARAIREATETPVRVIPHCLDLAAIDAVVPDKLKYNISATSLTFGFFFDSRSGLERKNVKGLIKAFLRAFQDTEDAVLILKANGVSAGSYEFESLKARFSSDRIVFLDQTFSRVESLQFLASLDVYVSLHRAEGFGLTLAESMALGTPVIATGYSGNLDFMTAENSMLVEYEIVTSDVDNGPYTRGTVWAEPDIDDAAKKMREMLSERRRRKLASVGRKSVRDTLSAQQVSQSVSSAIVELTSGR